jgi:hypothetical protein
MNLTIEGVTATKEEWLQAMVIQGWSLLTQNNPVVADAFIVQAGYMTDSSLVFGSRMDELRHALKDDAVKRIHQMKYDEAARNLLGDDDHA